MIIMCAPSQSSYHIAEGLTSFSRSVFRVVSQIPKGKVLTYQEVARRIRKPKSARAVGNALAHNIYQDVPCHRVVRSNGSLGGYAFGGPKTKEKQLKEEGVGFTRKGRVRLS